MDLRKESLSIIADLALRVLSTELFYIPKFVDKFEQLHEPVQLAFLKYMADSVGSDDWMSIYNEGDYRRLLTYILFCFTGNGDRGEPSKDELSSHLRSFVKSIHFKDALYDLKISELVEDML